MWPFCFANNPLWLLLPFLIGLLTGWWVWGCRPRLDAAVDVPAPAPAVSTPAPAVVPPVAAAVTPAAAPVVDVPAAPAASALAGVGALGALGIPAAVGDPDDLTQLKGIGPALNTLLNTLGVTRFDQIAAWSADDVAKVDGHLGAFKGRVDRDGWIEQARLLASGAIEEFERRFGTLGSENRP